jgi:hypothetical protein
VSVTFLSYASLVTPAGSFWTYAGVSAVGWVYFFFNLIETRGKSMEEIQMELKDIKERK